MERNHLYVLIFVLGTALGVTYVSKTKGGIDKIFAPSTPARDSWMRDDPGWDKMPNTPAPNPPAPVPPTLPPTPPPAPPTPPPQQPQPPRSNPPRQSPG